MGRLNLRQKRTVGLDLYLNALKNLSYLVKFQEDGFTRFARTCCLGAEIAKLTTDFVYVTSTHLIITQLSQSQSSSLGQPVTQ